MPKFRKKPIVVEAVLWTGNNLSDIAGSGCGRCKQEGTWLAIETPEGTMKAKPGDWIIKGVRGEFYPCDPHVFDETYELEEFD